MCQSKSSNGFSLIELLVVIVILGLIASIVAPNLMGKVGGAKAKTSRVQIEDLAAALELYYLDVGNYPSTEAGLAALIAAPENLKEWSGPYLRKNRIPVDPWGSQYHYKVPGEFAPFEIWSFGADKKPGGEGSDADIESWR
jgi:general secretion pathway protein G